MHKYTDDGMRSPTPSIPIAVSALSTHVFPACNANAVEGTRIVCIHRTACADLRAWPLAHFGPRPSDGAAPGMRRK